MASKYFKNVEKLRSLSLWLCTDLYELSLSVERLHSRYRYRFLCVPYLSVERLYVLCRRNIAINAPVRSASDKSGVRVSDRRDSKAVKRKEFLSKRKIEAK